jgi:hypothetical protein
VNDELIENYEGLIAGRGITHEVFAAEQAAQGQDELAGWARARAAELRAAAKPSTARDAPPRAKRTAEGKGVDW